MPPIYSTELRNAQQVPLTTIIGNGGKLKLLTSGNILLATFILATPAAIAPVNGIWTASAIASVLAIASGNIAKGIVTKSTDVLVISNLLVRVVAAEDNGEEIVLDAITPGVVINDNISINSFIITRGNI